MIDLLLENLGLVIDADGDGKRIREAILQLAVRGWLVAQDEGDEDARVVADRIRNEAIRAPKSRAKVIDEEEIPFSPPCGWTFVRLGQAMNLVNGKAFKKSEWSTVGLPIIRIQNLNDASAEFNYCSSAVPGKFHVDTGDLLFSWSGTPGTSFGAFIWNRSPGLLNQHIFRCEPRANAWNITFLRHAINSRLDHLISAAHGAVGLQHVTRGRLDGLWLPLPPPAEQHRIVEKVDELMGHAAVVESRHLAASSARMRFRDAALHALAEAEDHEAVEAAWSRIEDHFDDLFTEPEDIQPLRQTILQLAVRGRLVAQDEGGEDVADYCVANPFQIPSSWAWVCLPEVAECRLGKMLDKARNKGALVPYLRNTNIHWFEVRLDSLKEMRLEPDEIDEFKVLPGDVLVCEGGHGIGRAAVWEGGLEYVAFQKALHRIRPAHKYTGRFLTYCIAVYHETNFLATFYTGSGIPHLTGKALAVVPFPLPPLAEQQRIVEKVDQLMVLCDTLEASLTWAKTTREQFVTSISHALSAPGPIPT